MEEQLLAVFVVEADEQLTQLEAELGLLEQEGETQERIDSLFRVAHTFKGNASIVGLNRLAGLASTVEDALDALRAQRIVVTPQLIQALRESVAELVAMVPRATAGDDSIEESALAVFNRLRVIASQLEAPTPVGTSAAAPAVAPAGPGELRAPAALRTVRVDIARLDRLLSIAADLIAARIELGQAIDQLPKEKQRALAESFRAGERLIAELQVELMQARMVPIGNLFERFDRRATELGQSRGKPVALLIEGADVAADTALVDQLRDPILHLLRNSVDHGIEPAEVRRALGKPAHGVLRLAARQLPDGVEIVFEDDGAGLDRPRILESARRRGKALPDDAPDALVWEQIFEPGLTTATVVSDLSGRGVGMDVVRRSVATLRGTLDVESTAGAGTRFTMVFPLTLALVPSLFVMVAGEVVAIPLENVVECVPLPRGLAEQERLAYEGQLLPLVQITPHGERARAGTSALVLHAGDRRAALRVDQLISDGTAVVRPLGALFQKRGSWSGATVMPDGRVALVVNVGRLIASVSS